MNNNTAATTPITETRTVTHHVARPIYGAKAHTGFRMVHTSSSGEVSTLTRVLCGVAVQYNPSKTPDMPLDEVAAIITCPSCIKRTARLIERDAV
jgi:hypothetical protein